MPTTTYQDASQGVRAIGARTDFAGTPVEDLAAEEDRYINAVLSSGAFSVNAYVPAAGAGATMDVTIGSGTAKADYLVIAGQNSGQANYLVRLTGGSESVTLAAADPTLARTDEVYVVVRDNAYDASARALPVLAIRQGDAGGGAPGPDGTWTAYHRVASILVPGGAADIAACTVTDTRARAGFYLGGSSRLAFDSNLDTLVQAPSGKKVELQTGGTTRFEVSSTGADFKNLAVVGVASLQIAGVDFGLHDHSPGGVGGAISHDDLGDLGVGDPHPQYLLESGLTKAAIDALNVNADTVDGQHASAFSLTGHTHPYAADVHTHDDRYYTESQSDGRFYGGGQAGRNVTFSSSSPTGGSDGDMWFKY